MRRGPALRTQCRKGHAPEAYRRSVSGAPRCQACISPWYIAGGPRPVHGQRMAMTDRNDAIVAAIEGGEDAAEVGRRLGLTRERIRQVYTRATGKGIGHKRVERTKKCSTCAIAYTDWHAHVRTMEHFAARFWRQVAKSDYCWNWTGALAGGNGKGRPQYGHLSGADGEHLYAHRTAYELTVGPILPGLELDHECRNTQCVRPGPGHCVPVTHQENVQRGKNGRLRHLHAPVVLATHCKYGHAFDEANTYVAPNGARTCKTCGRRRSAAYNQRRRTPERERIAA